jgi:hypothetical protein
MSQLGLHATRLQVEDDLEAASYDLPTIKSLSLSNNLLRDEDDFISCRALALHSYY